MKDDLSAEIHRPSVLHLTVDLQTCPFGDQRNLIVSKLGVPSPIEPQDFWIINGVVVEVETASPLG